jgi:hypothetical protein
MSTEPTRRQSRSIWEQRDAHPHTSGQLHSGTYADKVERPDTGTSLDSIGKPFKAFGAHTPMMHTAPVTSFYAHHFTTPCPACQAGILWAAVGGQGVCGGCKTALTTHPDTGLPVVSS